MKYAQKTCTRKFKGYLGKEEIVFQSQRDIAIHILQIHALNWKSDYLVKLILFCKEKKLLREIPYDKFDFLASERKYYIYCRSVYFYVNYFDNALPENLGYDFTIEIIKGGIIPK